MSSPVAPLPGVDGGTIEVAGPLGSSATYDSDSRTVEFDAEEGVVGRVVIMDTSRDFGWTAIYPYWFTTSTAPGSVAALAADDLDGVGPLSTAVDLLMLSPSLSARDPDLFQGTIDALRLVEEVRALAAFLEANAGKADPMGEPGFASIYLAAIEAGVDAVNAAGLAASDVAPSSTTIIDQIFTVISEVNGDVTVAWDPDILPVNRALTHFGTVYEVDTTAYDSETELRTALINRGGPIAPELVSSVPVARLVLPAEDPFAILDLLGLGVDLVVDALLQVADVELAELPVAEDTTLTEGAYIVHIQTCATAQAAFSTVGPEWENYRDDLSAILGWPGTAAISNAASTCLLFAYQTALDIMSLVVDLGAILDDIDVFGGREPWATALKNTVTIATSTVNSGTANTWDAGSIVAMTDELWRALLVSVGQEMAAGGLKAAVKMYTKAHASLVDLPGKFSDAASLSARLVTSGFITPLESSLVVVGDPWDAPPPPPAGLVAHWPFNDCSDLGRDATGNGFDGTLGGSAGCTSGPDGTALDLSSSSSFLEVAQDFTLPSSGFTTALWVRIDQANTDFNYFLNGATTTRDNAFNFNWNPLTAAIEMGFGTQAGQSSTSTVNLVGAWHHLAFVNNSGTVTLYVDGAPFHTFAFSAQATPVQHLVFGQDQDCFAGCFEADQALLGSLDDVRIYDLPLTASEVETLATAPGGGTINPAPSYITIANVALGAGSGGMREVGFDISWDESWRGPDRPTWVAAPDNWDAAWVFVKYRVSGGTWQHATLASSGHSVPGGAVVDVPSDGMGAFVYRSGSGYGSFAADNVALQWDAVVDGVAAGASVEVQPFAIEMVYVPQGSFSVGSGGSSSGEFRAGGTTNTPFVVSSQSSIALGNEPGQLYWTENPTSFPSGSPSGSTSASYPTGYTAFYIMKHELTQGQYVGFLNTLSQAQADVRKYSGSSSRYAITGSSLGAYTTSVPYLAANFVNWADGAAFADWAGLRPMTELEFEKAARGTLAPVAGEYAWGNTSITQATGLVDSDAISETVTPATANANYAGALAGPVRAGSFAAPGDSRRNAGAGYYGALELSGNLYERPVTLGNAQGRAFTGAHGDGTLGSDANADVTFWPGASAVGAGFRGGYWSGSGVEEHARVSSRFHAAGTLSPRDNDHGWRGVRSAP